MRFEKFVDRINKYKAQGKERNDWVKDAIRLLPNYTRFDAQPIENDVNLIFKMILQQKDFKFGKDRAPDGSRIIIIKETGRVAKIAFKCRYNESVNFLSEYNNDDAITLMAGPKFHKVTKDIRNLIDKYNSDWEEKLYDEEDSNTRYFKLTHTGPKSIITNLVEKKVKIPVISESYFSNLKKDILREVVGQFYVKKGDIKYKIKLFSRNDNGGKENIDYTSPYTILNNAVFREIKWCVSKFKKHNLMLKKQHEMIEKKIYTILKNNDFIKLLTLAKL